jgi:hypothetical protein
MGIHQSDLKIRSAIILGLQDIKNNPWLIDYILEDVVKDPYLKDQYQTQIEACKEYLRNNEIEVLMRMRNDKDRYPCITITLGSSRERDDLKIMADSLANCTEVLMPNQIGKPIPYIIKPFTPTYYDSATGKIGIDINTPGFEALSIGQVVVDPEACVGSPILEIGNGYVKIEENIEFKGSELGIVPQYPFYKAKKEATRFEEHYTIGIHVHGDTQPLLWIHSIVMFALLRYRESMLEGRGFSQTTINTGDIMENPYFSGPGGEMGYSRSITVSGLVEHSWLKAPHRIVESVILGEKKDDGDCCTDDGYKGGIKILSNNRPNIREDEDVWYPIEDTAEFDDEI